MINIKDKEGNTRIKLEDAEDCREDKVVLEDGTEVPYLKAANEAEKKD